MTDGPKYNDGRQGGVTRSKQDARVTYNALSKWYDWLAGGSEKRICALGLLELNTREGESVLEIGFGTGRSLIALATAAGRSGRVFGIDISDGMLAVALARVRAAGLSDTVDLRLGDAIRLPFASDSMDAVFMSFALELFDESEITLVLQQCRRVLHPGGRICIIAMSKARPGGLMSKIYEWAHREFPRFVDCRPIAVQNTLQDAGFRISKAVESSVWGLPVEVVMANAP